MKAYTQFVIKMFECLSELYQADEKRMKIIFSEGKDFLTYSHHQEYSVLQNTRLSVVVDMAKKVTAILNRIDQHLTHGRIHPAVISQKSIASSFIMDI